ncbi:hypothetical protein DY023_00755 [Microbacterium bovistercoris]|uniref:Peptidase inhibitor family I36 n=1 Tax=Microbacterium bovistercoris TaxID=2293570 RepID=A0A371NY93_9MICO|nr:hypothetical protein [Microbacterium bovistercoris]REJ08533.1 hypothetical protein DY023_00755 [Microbacterium bovistercoris]
MKRKTGTRAAIAAMFGAAMLLASAPAAGAGTIAPEATEAAEPEQHCVQNLDTGSLVCGASDEALGGLVYDETGKVLIYQPNGTLSRAAASTAATYVIGVLYSYPNYGGSTRVLTGSTPCSSGGAYNYRDLSLIGWNNDIDSFKSYAGCMTKIWDATNFSGSAAYGYFTNKADLGSWRNRASSIRWQ